MTSFVHVCGCLSVHVSPRGSGNKCCVRAGQWSYQVWVGGFLISCSHNTGSVGGKQKMELWESRGGEGKIKTEPETRVGLGSNYELNNTFSLID